MLSGPIHYSSCLIGLAWCSFALWFNPIKCTTATLDVQQTYTFQLEASGGRYTYISPHKNVKSFHNAIRYIYSYLVLFFFSAIPFSDSSGILDGISACWRCSGSLHLCLLDLWAPSAALWWPSRSQCGRRYSAANHSPPSSGQWCRTGGNASPLQN